MRQTSSVQKIIFLPPFCCVRLLCEEEAQVLRRRGANADRGPIVLASETQGTERAGVCRYRSGSAGGGEVEWGGDNNPGRGVAGTNYIHQLYQ